MNCMNACTCWAGQSSQPSTELEDVLSFLEGAGKKQQVTKLRCRTIADTLMERCVLEEAGTSKLMLSVVGDEKARHSKLHRLHIIMKPSAGMRTDSDPKAHPFF